MKHLNHVYSSAFSPDGRTLLTVSSDGTSRLWSVPGGLPLTPPLQHQAEALLGTFSPNNQSFATAQTDGLVRVWRLGGDEYRSHELAFGLGNHFVRISGDGQHAILGGWNRQSDSATPQVFDVATGRPMQLDEQLQAATFSPDGNVVVTLSSLSDRPGRVNFWNWRTADQRLEPCPTPSEPIGVDFSPDGKLIAVVCRKGEILVIDADTRTVRARLVCADGEQLAIRDFLIRDWVKFSPNGELLTTWGITKCARVWATDSWKMQCEVLHEQREQMAYCHDACFSRDGRIIITAGSDNTVRIWNAKTGQPEAPPLPHPAWVFSARLSPDVHERFILSACRDHMARLWDWRAGEQIGPALGHADEVFGVDFSPDGRHLFTASKDGTARVWERKNGKPLTPPLRLGGHGYQVVVTPDGQYALVSGSMNNVRVFHYAEFASDTSRELDAPSLVLLSEILSGQRLHENGGSINLTTHDWMERWNTFHEKYPRFRQSPDAR